MSEARAGARAVRRQMTGPRKQRLAVTREGSGSRRGTSPSEGVATLGCGKRVGGIGDWGCGDIGASVH